MVEVKKEHYPSFEEAYNPVVETSEFRKCFKSVMF